MIADVIIMGLAAPFVVLVLSGYGLLAAASIANLRQPQASMISGAVAASARDPSLQPQSAPS